MSAGQTPKILIVGGFTFSRGEAGSNIVIGLGNALEGAGYCVEFVAEDQDGTTVREDFQKFTCHIVPSGPALRGWRSAIVNTSASNHSVLKWLGQAPAPGFHAVIVYPGGDFPVVAIEKLRRLCSAKAWKLAIVVGEWQGFRQFGMLKLRHRLLAVVDSEIQRRVVNKRVHHVIALSRLFERYYTNSGCHAVLVPPLIDTHAKKWDCLPVPKPDNRGVKLVFSGAWWRDRLDLMTEAVLRLKGEGHDIVLELLGAGPDDIVRNPLLRKQMKKAPDGTFRFQGKVPLEKLLPMTASADFGVMLRDRVKWSDACFPSKVPEFQALGVPLLCNLTSDLGEFLTDGENALVVPQVSAQAFATTVRRGLALTPAEIHRMRQRSVQCAARRFDSRIYSDSLGKFIREM